MLILSRKRNETIHIGEDIVVKVSQITGSRVRLAIEAPAHVTIHRCEIIPRLDPPLGAAEAEMPSTP